MKLQELKEWIKTHRCIDHVESFFDGNGNHDEVKIYEGDGKLWKLEFFNDHPCQKYGDRGYIKDEYYEPEEVVKKTRTITETYYEPKTPIS